MVSLQFVRPALFSFTGAVAQLGEHLVCNQGVVGSNPIRSTPDCLPFQAPYLPASLP